MGRLALAFLGCILLVQLALRMLHRAFPSAILVRFAASLERPIRARLLGPTVLARRVGLRPGMRVLHVGPGDPAMTDALNRTVGPTGYVTSLALAPNRSASPPEPQPTNQVTPGELAARPLSTLPFEDQSFDAVCLVSALGRLPDRRTAVAEIWRVLRPAGRLSASEVLGDPAYRLRRTLESWGESAGFERLEHFGNIIAYTTNFRKPLVLAAT